MDNRVVGSFEDTAANPVRRRNVQHPTTTTPTPTTEWAKTYSFGSPYDAAYLVRQTSDGGYVLSGSQGFVQDPASSTSSTDQFVIKVNAYGAVQWAKRYPAPCSHDGPGVISRTSGDGFILAAAGRPSCNTSAPWFLRVTKLSATGDIVWQRQHSPASAYFGLATHVDQTADGGYVVVGGVGPYGNFIVKLDAQGSAQWTKALAFASSGSGSTRYAKPMPDGSLLVVGTAGGDVRVTKLGPDGSLVWDQTYGEAGSYAEGMHLHLTLDGGFVLNAGAGGYANDGSWHNHLWIVKADAAGQPQWEKRYTASGGPELSPASYSLHAMAEGGFILAGNLRRDHGAPDGSFMAHLADDGSIIWERHFDFAGTDSVNAMQMLANGGFVAVGNTISDSTSHSGRQFLLYSVSPDGLIGTNAPMSAGLIEEDTSVSMGVPAVAWMDQSVVPGTATPIGTPVNLVPTVMTLLQ